MIGPLHRGTVLLAALCTTFAPQALSAQQAPPTDVAAVHAQLLRAAQISDPTLRAARARLAAERARARLADIGPVTGLDAEFADGLGGNIATGNLTLTASRPFVGSVRRRAARDLAAADVQALDREILALERALALQLTSDLAASVGSTRIVRRLEASDAWLADAERSLTARYANGEARYLDVLRVRTERLQLAAERASELGARRMALAALRLRVGSAGADDSLGALVQHLASSDDTTPWLALLGARPSTDSLLDLSDALREARGAEQRTVALRAQQVAEQRAQWSGLAGLQRIGPDNGGPSIGIVLGLSTTLPFTAARGIALTQAAADADVAAAGVATAVARASAAAALESALARDDSAMELLQLYAGVLGAASASERDAALTHYRNGSLSLLELLDFERALLRVEIERARAIAAAASARAALFGLNR